MDDEIVIRRAEGAMDAVVDGRTVLLSPRDFSYHGLDPVGARIWTIVADPRTVGEAVSYTHLDVYKRQGRRGSRWPQNPRRLRSRPGSAGWAGGAGRGTGCRGTWLSFIAFYGPRAMGLA